MLITKLPTLLALQPLGDPGRFNVNALAVEQKVEVDGEIKATHEAKPCRRGTVGCNCPADAAQLGVEDRLLPVFDAPNSREWRGPRLDFRRSPASKLPSPAEPQNGFRCNEIICGKFMA